MDHTALTLLILKLNKLLDSGKYYGITVYEAKTHIEDRTVLTWLRVRAKGDIDLSTHLDTNTYGNFDELHSNYLANILGGYEGEERRKWGVQKKGRNRSP